jgi:hypothetical protein
MREITEDRPPAMGKVIRLTTLALLALTVVCWPLVKFYQKSVHDQTLLGEFIQVSDDFTRPKFFVHRSFHQKDPADKTKHFIYRMGAYSDGKTELPAIPNKNNKGTTYKYHVIINLDDRIFEINTDGYSNTQAILFALHEWAEEKSDLDDLKLKCRIKSSPFYNEVFDGDFTLTSEELAAFLKTIELSKLFRDSAK